MQRSPAVRLPAHARGCSSALWPDCHVMQIVSCWELGRTLQRAGRGLVVMLSTACCAACRTCKISILRLSKPHQVGCQTPLLHLCWSCCVTHLEHLQSSLLTLQDQAVAP